MSGTTHEARTLEVRAALDAVTDPELDESVISLGFVSRIAVDAHPGPQCDVEIGFRLPTYWCSANFAWIMAEDMRDNVRALPWTGRVTVTLDEHMFGDAINTAMRDNGSFQDAFGPEADSASLAAVRANFAAKAFGRRQLALIEALLADGRDAGTILSLRIGDLPTLPHPTLVRSYLARRRVPGAFTDTDPAFIDASGATILAPSLARHLSSLRSIVVNMEFNGALCRGLLAARYNEPDTIPAVPASEPELIDFIRNARHAA